MLQRSFLIFIILVLAASSALAIIPVQTLVENGKTYDEQVVEIQGEAIGDILVRGQNAWMNVLAKDGNAIGILCSKEQAQQIKILGNYKNRGDEVLVTGTFYRFMKEQSGETSIKAQSITIIRSGYPTNHKIPQERLIFALFLLLLTGIAILYFQKENKAPPKT